MRVLVLSYETPAYPAGGGASRQHCLLEPLASRHQIRVLTTGGRPVVGSTPAGVEMKYLDPGHEVGDPDEGWLKKNLRHYVFGPPWLFRTALHHCLALAARAPDEIESFQPDVVQIEHGELGPLLQLIPPGLPAVLSLADILLAVQYQQLYRGASWLRVKSALDLPVLARQMRSDFLTATRTITVTHHDQRMAQRLAPRAEVRMVPNCTDVSYFRRATAPGPDPAVIFPASFNYAPNSDAARELLTDIWPRVRHRVPTAELVLPGHGMPTWLERLADAADGVSTPGAVPDIRPYLWASWVLVAPLRTGSGSPLKVVEALAAGVPVVTTGRVAGALKLGAADGVVVGETSAEIAERIISLLEDPSRRSALAQAGVAAAAPFDRARVAPRQEAVWQEAVAAVHGTSPG